MHALYDVFLGSIAANKLNVLLCAGRAYRFRVVAIYSNSESRHSPMSVKLITDSTPAILPKVVPSPVIAEVRPLSVSEIFIGWQVSCHIMHAFR
jgi:hypothetical protein